MQSKIREVEKTEYADTRKTLVRGQTFFISFCLRVRHLINGLFKIIDQRVTVFKILLKGSGSCLTCVKVAAAVKLRSIYKISICKVRSIPSIVLSVYKLYLNEKSLCRNCIFNLKQAILFIHSWN